MPQVIFVETLQGAGGTIGGRARVRTVDHVQLYSVALPVAVAVTGWLKTDGDTASCTPASAQTPGKFDVYWSGGMRYGCDLTDIGTTGNVQLDGGAGDDFPANGTTGVVICAQVSANTNIDGDNVKIIGFELLYADIDSTKLGHIDMQDAGSATIEEIDLSANRLDVRDITGGDSNVFTGNVITVSKISHNDTVNTATLNILCGDDATP